MILLITPQNVIDKTPFSGNIDYDKIVPCIEDAQVMDLEPLIGQVLFDKIVLQKENNTLSGKYLILYNDFIINYLIRATAKNILLVLAYQIANGGIYKHTSANSESVSKEEVDYLMTQQKSKMEAYGLRLQRWLRFNNIPEYLQFSQIVSKKNQEVGSWYMGKNSCRDSCDNSDQYL
jgi:hypothetical protein